MESHFPIQHEEKSNTRALVLSAAVHLGLIAALFFGVQWKSEQTAGVAVEVFHGVPGGSVAPPLLEAEPPRPQPKPEPKPVVKPEPKAAPEPKIKPDIAVKEEKKKEEPKKPEPKKQEPKKEEPKKPEPDRRRNLDDELKRELKQAEQQKAAQTQRARAENEAKLRAQLDAEGSPSGTARDGRTGKAGGSGRIGDPGYADRIRLKIRGNIVLPQGIQGNPEAIFEVTQLPSGEIIAVKLQKSSGNRVLDEAIERAINKSSPLPKPDNPAAFERILSVKYKPFDG